MKQFDNFRLRRCLWLAGLLLFLGVQSAKAQYYYAQWTSNLVAGDNTFNITTGATNTNWASGVQAITPELLANSVTVSYGGSNVSATVKKVSTTQFTVNVSSALSGAVVTAQYPGAVVAACSAPTLISAVRSTSNPTDVTFTWNNNGTNYGTIAFEYSTNGGASWTGTCYGSTVSPRVCTIPNQTVLVRVHGYATGCDLVSNSLTLNAISNYTSNGCQAVGNYYSDPKNLGCGSICVTFSTTNFTCYLTVPTTSVTTGTQIYLLNTSTNQPVPATAANCAAYGAAAGTTCNKIDTGLRWIRFVSGSNASVIYNVDPSTGIVTGSSLTCP